MATVALLCASLGSHAGHASHVSTAIVSLSVAGGAADALSGSPALVSLDGSLVAFWSKASNLILGDTNGVEDAFVRDVFGRLTERVSVGPGGVQADGRSFIDSMSPDGRFVSFHSQATNLSPLDPTDGRDVYVHDRRTRETELVSVGLSGSAGSGWSYSSAVSADGRFVAFASEAEDLVAGDTNGLEDVFLRDRMLGRTTRVSISDGGSQGEGPSGSPAISASGRAIVFASSADNLVAGDTNGTIDIFVRDVAGGRTTLVSRASSGAQANGPSTGPAISGDGSTIAFESDATNLVADDRNGLDAGLPVRVWGTDIFVHDRRSGTTEMASISSLGLQGDKLSLAPSLSADGRFVAFYSYATSLVAGDTNGQPDVFVRDTMLGKTVRVSIGEDGRQGVLESFEPTLSADGRFVAFTSRAQFSSVDSNDLWDIYLRDRGRPTCPEGGREEGEIGARLHDLEESLPLGGSAVHEQNCALMGAL